VERGFILKAPATKGRIVTTIWATDQLVDHTPHSPAGSHAAVHPDERVQQLVHDLMRERLNELFGPGGSFRVTLGRATQDDALFVSTVADTIAWDVAAALDETVSAEEHRHASPRRLAEDIPSDEHDEIWRHVEDELLKRRKAA
jgi:hypothetical protein